MSLSAVILPAMLGVLFAAHVDRAEAWDLTEFRSPQEFRQVSDFMNGEAKTGSEYTDTWLVHVDGGPLTAAIVARDLGYENLGKVPGFENFYLMKRRGHAKTEKRGANRLTQDLQQHAKVVWAEQQVSKRRDKRDLVQLLDPPPPGRSRAEHSETEYPRVGSSASIDQNKNGVDHRRRNKARRFNDELWDHEWYLQDTRTMESLPELDLHVLPVYDMGITGKGVKITVLDDGLEYNHTDLFDNHDPSISYDANDRDSDPSPRYDEIDTNSHGTRCAGEIAMVANNGKCGVGVAHSASIGGIRMLDGIVTDAVEGMSLGFNVENIDIFSSSWGPADDGRTVEGPGELTQRAFVKGVSKGRKGKGSIYIWAAGNGGHRGDSCACDGYASSPYTISIGSASQSGKFPWYGERCGSTMAATYSSGAYRDQKITTTDLHDSCTVDHTGTSAAAPLAAGIVALVLEANSNLTWRDVQYLIVLTSDYRPLFENAGWSINAIGRMFNPRFGFGLMNAHAMVRAALNWTNVPNPTMCTQRFRTNEEAKITNAHATSLTYDVSVCNGEGNKPVNSLEHVEITVNIQYPKRGALKIDLISPSGTSSEILNPRENDNSSSGFKDWTFMSVHFWGEDPRGNWTVVVEDADEQRLGEAKNEQREGTWGPVTFKFHGTEQRPEALKPRFDPEDIASMRAKLAELNELEMEKERLKVSSREDDLLPAFLTSPTSSGFSTGVGDDSFVYPDDAVERMDLSDPVDSSPAEDSADVEEKLMTLALSNLLREPRIGSLLADQQEAPNSLADDDVINAGLHRDPPQPLMRFKRDKRSSVKGNSLA